MKTLGEILLLHFLWLFPFWSPEDVQGRAAAQALLAVDLPRGPLAAGMSWPPPGRPGYHRGGVGRGAQPLCPLCFPQLEAVLLLLPWGPCGWDEAAPFFWHSLFFIVMDFKELLLFKEFW